MSHDNWQIKGCPHHGPAISIADDGVYHITWFNNAPDSHGLFYVSSVNKAANFSTPLNFGDYEKSASHPDVLSLGKHVYIVWKEFDGKISLITGFVIAGDMRHCISGGEGTNGGRATFLFGGNPVLSGVHVSVEGEHDFAGDGFAPRKPQS